MPSSTNSSPSSLARRILSSLSRISLFAFFLPGTGDVHQLRARGVAWAVVRERGGG